MNALLMLAAAAQPAAVVAELPLAGEAPVAAERGVSAYAPDFFASVNRKRPPSVLVR